MKTTFEPLVQEFAEREVDMGRRVQISGCDAGWTIHTFEGDIPGDTIITSGDGKTFRDAVIAHANAKPRIVKNLDGPSLT